MVLNVTETRPVEERARIVRRAQDLFFAHGFARVTTEEIARELGISKKTLYAHFENKEDLLRAAVAGLRDDIYANIVGVVEDRSSSFVEKLSGVLEALGTGVSRMRPPFLAELQRKAPDVWDELEAFRREHVFEQIERLFLQGSRRGMLRKNINPEVFLQMFFSVVRAVLTPESISQMSLTAAEAFRTILSVLLTGVLTDEARESFEVIQSSQRGR